MNTSKDNFQTVARRHMRRVAGNYRKFAVFVTGIVDDDFSFHLEAWALDGPGNKYSLLQKTSDLDDVLAQVPDDHKTALPLMTEADRLQFETHVRRMFDRTGYGNRVEFLYELTDKAATMQATGYAEDGLHWQHNELRPLKWQVK